ncbi:MAG: guanylate kinase [Candidatus Accumulibacter sp.]|jgi:guanylate kinase|nr:guanylate kinase [Accumulibacter sp.]
MTERTKKPQKRGGTETRGHLYILSAPSGAGKTTLVRMLLESDPKIHLSVSSTTRAPREGEAHGREYYFTSVEDFLERANRGEFLEWAKVHDNYYGTSKSWIDAENNAGHDVLLEIDWQGAQQVRKIFPNAVGIFILPPTIESLKERLIRRGTDAKCAIDLRIESARDEMRHVSEFDYVIINADLPRAFQEISSIINASRLQYATQRQRHAELFSALL